MTIKNILVPYDGSPLSKKALALAKDIARNFTADLTLLMVIPVYYPINDSMFSGVAVTNYQEIIKILREQGEKELGKVVEKCRDEGTKTSYKIVHADVSNAILKETKIKSRYDNHGKQKAHRYIRDKTSWEHCKTYFRACTVSCYHSALRK